MRALISHTQWFRVSLCCIGLVVSCHNEDITISRAPLTFDQVFDAFWNKMNTNYVYWDVDSTDWDGMFIKYKPIFEKLDLEDEADRIQSVQYFRDMTAGLIDGHYHISFRDARINGLSVYPSLTQRQRLPNFHNPYAYFKIDTTYLDADYRLGFDHNNRLNGQPLAALSGTIDNRILFFSCSTFSLLKSFESAEANGVQSVLDYFFSRLSNLPPDIKGIIVDVRGNLGGDLSDLNFFVGRFIDKPLHFGFTQSKSGNGRLDFTPWIKAYVNPVSGASAVNIPIIVLADVNTASLGEAVVMALKSLPNAIFIGETTWGATGPLTDEELYNAGQFEVDGFLSVKTSSSKFRFLDGKIYEGIGFPPDVYVSYNSRILIDGKDVQLEKAIGLIK